MINIQVIFEDFPQSSNNEDKEDCRRPAVFYHEGRESPVTGTSGMCKAAEKLLTLILFLFLLGWKWWVYSIPIWWGSYLLLIEQVFLFLPQPILPPGSQLLLMGY